MKKGAKLYFNKKGYEKDPGVNYSMDLNDIYADFVEQIGAVADSIAEQENISAQLSSVWRKTCLTIATPTSPCD